MRQRPNPRDIRRCLGVLALAIALTAAGCGTGGGGSNTTTGSRAGLAWSAPKLSHPGVIDVRPGNTDLNLDPHRDYLLRLPSGRPLNSPKGLRIQGGHNVVLVGGTLNVPGKGGGILLRDQTGTMHLEGVRITGPALEEGIDIDQRKGATVQLQNLWLGTVHGSYRTNHADLIQTWAGPRRLRIDGLVGTTQYQGFFLLPNQFLRGPRPAEFDLRNIYIDARRGGYGLWRGDPAFPVRTSNVWVAPNPTKRGRDDWLWPKPSTGDRSWRGVRAGTPRDLIKRVRRAGVLYRGG
jgi:hypothetical protein